MPHTQPTQSADHSRAPRSHRDPQPVSLPRRASRHAWHARIDEADGAEQAHTAGAAKPDFISAQAVFFIARGLAALAAAIAVGLGAMPAEPETQPAPPPTSSQATAH